MSPWNIINYLYIQGKISDLVYNWYTKLPVTCQFVKDCYSRKVCHVTLVTMQALHHTSINAHVFNHNHSRSSFPLHDHLCAHAYYIQQGVLVIRGMRLLYQYKTSLASQTLRLARLIQDLVNIYSSLKPVLSSSSSPLRVQSGEQFHYCCPISIWQQHY